jgi:hypothetical protein
MLVFEVNLNVFIIIGVVAVAGFVGFLFRSSQIGGLKKKVNELEKEMLSSHAEILQLQKEKIELLQKFQTPTIPVIPLKAAKEEKAADSFTDISLRKKLLGSQPAGTK